MAEDFLNAQRPLDLGGEIVNCGLHFRDGNTVANHSLRSDYGTCGQLNRLARAENHCRQTPRFKRRLSFDHYVGTVEKDDVDGKSHGQRVHPHQRNETLGLEQHPLICIQLIAA
jgi:hypothetical protein